MTRKAKTRGNVAGGGSRSGRRFNQRCAVRVMYSRNAARGQWGAHGRYVARESAAHCDGDRASGFDDRTESIVIARRLDGWQCAGDERMWKFIVSPELGEQVDLKRLTRELMGRIERELGGGRLEWIAVDAPQYGALVQTPAKLAIINRCQRSYQLRSSSAVGTLTGRSSCCACVGI